MNQNPLRFFTAIVLLALTVLTSSTSGLLAIGQIDSSRIHSPLVHQLQGEDSVITSRTLDLESPFFGFLTIIEEIEEVEEEVRIEVNSHPFCRVDQTFLADCADKQLYLSTEIHFPPHSGKFILYHSLTLYG